MTAAVFAAAVGMVSVLTTSQAHAEGYNFEDDCSTTATDDLDPVDPNALMMLDRSGSMGFLTNSSGTRLWNVAVDSIKSGTQTHEENIRFGLGYFHGRSTTRIEVGCSLNNHSAIASDLDSESPGSLTPTSAAIDEMASSSCLNDDHRGTGGLLITDGNPTDGRSNTIQSACDARDQGHLMYAMGLGGATDQEFNNKMAAAMGTGCCEVGGGTCDPDDGVGADDPCDPDVSVNKQHCEGAYEVHDEEQFTNVIDELSGQMYCTFAIDTSQHADGEAPDNTDAVKIEWDIGGTTETIPHRSEDADGEGWYFPSEGSRTQVSLTDGLCSQIQESEDLVDEVRVHLACDCSWVDTGEECESATSEFGACSQGTYACKDSGYRYCDNYDTVDCPEDCPNTDSVMGEVCHLDNVGDYGEISTPGQVYEPHDPSEEIERCKVGRVACDRDLDDFDQDRNVPVCNDVLNPMPERCDGLDNSCSGRPDDISSSWEDWYEGTGPFTHSGVDDNPELLPDDAGENETTCWLHDSCICDGGNGEHVGTGDDIVEEFQDYMDSWEDPEACYCDVQMRP